MATDIRIAMPQRDLRARARLVWQGWNAAYWQRFFADISTVRPRLNSIMQGYLVVATLLVVMAFPTLFALLAIKEADQRDTKAFKACVFDLAVGCLTSLSSIFMLTSALAVASLPDTVPWSAALSARMQALLAREGLAFYTSILAYSSAIPCGFFAMMHRTVAAWATAVFAVIFISMAIVFGYYQGDLLEVLQGQDEHDGPMPPMEGALGAQHNGTARPHERDVVGPPLAAPPTINGKAPAGLRAGFEPMTPAKLPPSHNIQAQG